MMSTLPATILGGVRMSMSVKSLTAFKKTYCENIGVEYLHLQTTEKRRWIQSKIEPESEPAFI